MMRFWDRWIALQFGSKFDVNPTFEETTFTGDNLSGFLNLVLAEMKRIINIGGLKMTESVETTWLNDSSSCYRFILEELERMKNALLIKREVYSAYANFCHDGDYEVETTAAFYHAMVRVGALSVKPKIKGKQEHCYKGYKIKVNDEPLVEKEESEISTKSNLNSTLYTYTEGTT
jgi:phage/plasmid-associated DNA primase